jgi:hypothetical protein
MRVIILICHVRINFPKNSSVSLKETPHAKVHTAEYLRNVLDRLRKAENIPWNGNPPTAAQQRQNILNELGKIRQELIQHRFPYQKVELEQDGVVAQQNLNIPTQEQINAYIAQVNPGITTLVDRTRQAQAEWNTWQAQVKASPASIEMFTGRQFYDLSRMPQVALNNRNTDLGRATLGLTVASRLLNQQGIRQPDGSTRFEGTEFTYIRNTDQYQILRTLDQSPVFSIDRSSKELVIPISISDREAAIFERNDAITPNSLGKASWRSYKITSPSKSLYPLSYD